MNIFNNGDCKIIHSDIFKGLDIIQNESVDLIFIDPPYNIGKNFDGLIDKWNTEQEYLNWCYSWLEICLKKLKKSGSMYFMSSTQCFSFFDIFLRDKINVLNRIIWHYDSSSVQSKKYFSSLYEPILYCVNDKNKYTFNSNDILVEAKTGAKRKLIDYRKKIPRVYNSQKIPGNVWYFNRVRYRSEEYQCHPTQKPIALLERIIKASSNIGDIVLDPFSGSFTTGFVSQKLNRHFIGIEIQEKYVNIGLKRLGFNQ